MRGSLMLNRFSIQGYLSFDPEIKTTSGGVPFTVVKLANRRPTKEKKPYFIDVMAFGSLAELIKKYLHKGSEAIFEGYVSSRKADEGYNSLSLIAENFYFTGSKKQSKEDDDSESEYEQLPF